MEVSVLLLRILACSPYSPGVRSLACELGDVYLCGLYVSLDYDPDEVSSQEPRLTKTHPAHASSSR